MINGIKPNLSNTTKTEKTMTKNGLSFDDAMDNLLVKIQEDYDNRQEIIDKLFNADFNYDIEKFSEENIYNELIGDRMGFTGQPKDYNYTITKIINIEPITMKQIKYVAKTYKDFF